MEKTNHKLVSGYGVIALSVDGRWLAVTSYFRVAAMNMQSEEKNIIELKRIASHKPGGLDRKNGGNRIS